MDEEDSAVDGWVIPNMTVGRVVPGSWERVLGFVPAAAALASNGGARNEASRRWKWKL